jgi:hypothetical protein
MPPLLLHLRFTDYMDGRDAYFGSMQYQAEYVSLTRDGPAPSRPRIIPQILFLAAL